ncbi:MAG: GGDEF domain-containing protein [Butyrivibrio sp.]|nr:GGDEF domain-containing protein [Butyrivibrio sp.]
MELNQPYILKFIRETYEIDYSANYAFYAFVGDRRYYKFNQLVHPDDMDKLNYALDNNLKEYFPLRLIDSKNESQWCVCSIVELTDVYCILEVRTFKEVRNVIDYYKRYFTMGLYILEGYGDYYFEYSSETSLVNIFVIHKAIQKYMIISLKELENQLIKNTDSEEQIRINTFLLGLTGGKGFFALVNKNNFIDTKPSGKSILIKGASYDIDGVIKSCGYIHLIDENEKEISTALPETDYLTGVLNKAEITNIALNRINTRKIPNTTIAIIDVDHFKKVNDTFGHPKGDEVLKTVASIIEKEAGPGSITGRIGGDEFMVIFDGLENMEKSREYLRGMKNRIHLAFPGNNCEPYVTLSIGCATYPKDADNYEDILTLADYSLYLAKSKGKDRYIIYDVLKHDSLKEIQESNNGNLTNNDRYEMTPGNAVCTIYDRVLNSDTYEIQKLLEDILVYFKFNRVIVYAGEDKQIVGAAGNLKPGFDVLQKHSGYLNNPKYIDRFSDKGDLIINNITYFENRIPEAYEMFIGQNTASIMQFRSKDKQGTEFILSIEAVGKIFVWNQENIRYYRLLANAIGMYRLC